MDEFEKIKTFSESLAEREQNLNEKKSSEPSINEELSLPQYLSQFRAVPAQEEKEPKTLLWIMLVAGLLIAAGAIFALVQRIPNMDENKIVVITPTPTPVKVLPDNPGGLNIPDRDKVVYNRAELTPTPVIENIFPETEQPILPEQVIQPVTKEEIVQEIAMEITPEKELEQKKTSNEEEVIKKEEKTEAVVLKKDSQEQQKAEIQEESIKKTDVIWRAQLLSSSNKSKVENSWETISKAQKSLLSDMPYQIVSATISGKGTFWRLQVGEFASREMVMNLCEKLKKKKQDCIPVKQ